MKLSGADQKTVNDFFRNYVDRGYKNPMNAVRLNVDHTDAHRRTIFEVCNALLDEKIPFWTEVRLKCGCIPDVVAPTHVVPIIEVLSSETEKQFYDITIVGPTGLYKNKGTKAAVNIAHKVKQRQYKHKKSNGKN